MERQLNMEKMMEERFKKQQEDIENMLKQNNEFAKPNRPVKSKVSRRTKSSCERSDEWICITNFARIKFFLVPIRA